MDTYEQRKRKEVETELALWQEMNAGVTGKPPEKQTWTDTNEIIRILNNIGQHKASNHTFMPSGGGLDLSAAHPSHESDLIEVNFDGTSMLVKPKALYFHAIGDNPGWWYFRLDTERFAASGIYEDDKLAGYSKAELVPWSDSEEVEWLMQYSGESVLEIAPGYYVDRQHWEENHLGLDENGDEIPLPAKARPVLRRVNGGSFVIYSKKAPYNRVPSTYDGRHNRMTDEEFRQYNKEIFEGRRGWK